ncbi:hypothetical protein BHE74_00007779 [Ensete ventricosum]|nr:hypothetical protein GW17_00006728 [Ensete ventricosum]RWW83704.1 hypothetical protein BHE74_00007779 [Ensete ventricosum]RZR81444.1 hypothetical protein BHM03_00007670 [Ensete ventricosum]
MDYPAVGPPTKVFKTESYRPKQVDNSRFRPSPSPTERYQPGCGLATTKEKEKKTEKGRTSRPDPAPPSLDDPEPALPALAERSR